LGALPPAASTGSTGAALAVSGATIAASFTQWWAARRNPTFVARLEEVLFLMVEEIHRIQLQGVSVRLDHPQFLEGLEAITPIAMRAWSQEKRRWFALLLAHTGAEMDPAARDQGQSMAHFLEQLDEHDVLLLDRVVAATTDEETHEYLGHVRYAHLAAINLRPDVDGPSWLRLHSLNLLSGGDTLSGGFGFESEHAPKSQIPKYRRGVAVTPLGLLLRTPRTSKTLP
jgi:hypothetical protein